MSDMNNLNWTFDLVASDYEKIRPGYPKELYNDIFKYIKLNDKSILAEVGIGGGQATDPFLKAGCTVNAIEYGKNLTEVCKKKFSNYKNFSITNSKFEDFKTADNVYDLIYSATAFHWIPEELGYKKVYSMLKKGGVFARFAHHPFLDNSYKELWDDIQKLYLIYYPTVKNQKEFSEEQAKSIAEIPLKYGFTDIKYKLYKTTITYTSSDYIKLLSTYSDHIAIEENIRKEFFSKIKQTIDDYGGIINKLQITDLQLARK